MGTSVKEYTVEIKNLGETGNYFIVTFNLKDKYGFEKVESVTHYIKTKETRKFVYRDVQFEKNEILRWRYTIDQTYWKNASKCLKIGYFLGSYKIYCT